MKTNKFNINKKGDVKFITIPFFEKTGLVNHGFSTRLGGVSKGIYESMNLGFNTGDNYKAVKENFQRFCNAINIPIEHLVFSDQVHEDKIIIVDKKDLGKGILKERDYKGVDGLITQTSGVALVTFFAACVPLFFLDPVKKVIALSHAGWRGTVKEIGPKTVRKMEEKFNCNPSDILAAIGPSIGQCCFEVSEDVKIEVEKIYSHDIIEKIVKRKNNNKYMIDLWTANEISLMNVGILKENITKTDICTMCNKDILFSHRGSEGKRGSLAAIMELR